MQELKPIPKEIKKKYPECRWVEVRNYVSYRWKTRILIADLGENVLESRFICVGDYNDDEFLNDKNFGWTNWTYMREIQQPKEPQKIPYTAETFPEEVIKIREKGKKQEFTIISKCDDYIIVFNKENTIFFEDSMDKYEICCLRDGKLIWEPFYQLK